jgi:hypothetical protein
MTEADLRRVLQAADRMYDAIRAFIAGQASTALSYRELRKAADAYDAASEQAGPSPLVNPPDVGRN